MYSHKLKLRSGDMPGCIGQHLEKSWKELGIGEYADRFRLIESG